MPKSKPVENSDDEIDQIKVDDTKPVAKSKKTRTPAQQEAFAKALSVLKEKREAIKKDEAEKLAKASNDEKERIMKEKYEKAKNHRKKLPPAPSYVTTGDLEKFKSDLLGALKPVEPVIPKKPVEVVKPEPVIVKEPVSKPIVQKPLTGHDLLDKLFFT